MLKLKKLFIFFLIIFAVLSTNIIFAKEENNYVKSYYGAILSGQIANYNNDLEVSADFFNFANEINPKNIEIYNLTLMSLVMSGKIDAAVSKVKSYEKRYGKKYNKSIIANFIKFISEIKNRNYEDALELLLDEDEFLITKKMKPILEAWISANFNKAMEALNQYEYKSEGLALSNIYYHHLALVQNYFKKTELAKKTFEKYLTVFELEKLRTLYFYENFLKVNKFIEDDQIVTQFLEKYPDHSYSVYLNNNERKSHIVDNPVEGISEAIYNLARTLFTQDMYETSLALAQTALFLDNENHIIKYLISLNLNSLKKKQLAIKYLKKIPNNSYVYWNSSLTVAELYTDLKKYDLAKSYLNKLENLDGKKIEVMYKLGEIFHVQEKYEEAIKYFSASISSLEKINDKHWYLFYSRGMSYERFGKWSLAEKDFLYSLKLSPDQPLTLNYLGYSWIDLGKNIDEAHEFIKKAIKIRPNDGYFVDSLGWGYYRMGEYEKAVIELEKAVSLVPNDPIINDHLGDALWRAGYKNEAIYQWNRALIYKPDDELQNKIKFKLKKGL